MGENYRDELGNAMMRAERAEARAHELQNAEERALAAEAEVARLRGAATPVKAVTPEMNLAPTVIGLVVTFVFSAIVVGVWFATVALPGKRQAEIREAEIARAEAEEAERVAAAQRALEAVRKSLDSEPPTVPPLAPPAPVTPPLPRNHPAR